MVGCYAGSMIRDCKMLLTGEHIVQDVPQRQRQPQAASRKPQAASRKPQPQPHTHTHTHTHTTHPSQTDRDIQTHTHTHTNNNYFGWDERAHAHKETSMNPLGMVVPRAEASPAESRPPQATPILPTKIIPKISLTNNFQEVLYGPENCTPKH